VLATVTAVRADDVDGKIVYVRLEGTRYVIHVMNADGTGDKELPGQTAAVNMFPTVSPDGKRIAFMTGADPVNVPFQIAVINVDGSALRLLDGPNPMNGRPAWSPDGKQIAFSSGPSGVPGIYLWDLDTNATLQVTLPAGGQGASPFFRKDGAIGYTALKPDGSSELAFIKPDGSGYEKVADGVRLILGGANSLAPDGKQVAYYTLDLTAATMSLRLLELSSKSDRTLFEGKDLGLLGFPRLPSASWTPDGKALIATLPSDKGAGLYRVSLDGTMKKRLSPEGVNCIHPATLKVG
jgi:Tol biopolymer transport system component